MEAVTLTRLQARQAAAWLRGLEHLDPRGVMTPGDVLDMCERGLCFHAGMHSGEAVYVLHVDRQRGHVQVMAALGAASTDLTATVLPIIEAQAAGMRRVTLQTRRRGLVRKLQRHGYTVRGWILGKDIA